MKIISGAVLTLIFAMLNGCAASKVSEEYGSSMGATMFACPGETWYSKATNEKYCVSHSVKNPYDYMISEDTAEEWGDAFVYGFTLGIAALFESDIQEKWLKAARELAEEKYGPGSRVVNFRPNKGQWKAMAFEIVPGSQSLGTSALVATSTATSSLRAQSPPSASGGSKSEWLGEYEYTVRQLTKSIGCVSPKLLSTTPATDVFQVECGQGQYRIIQCGVAGCNVLQ